VPPEPECEPRRRQEREEPPGPNATRELAPAPLREQKAP
jgi:hypothetical protein